MKQARRYIVPLALGALIAFGFIAAGQANRRIDDIQLENQGDLLDLQCQSAENQQDMLKALHELSDRLGVPVRFTVPEVPPECDGT